MEFSVSDKTEILLHSLDSQIKIIEQGEEREQQLFQWSTSLLLASFGAVVALSDRPSTLPFAGTVKLLATALIAVPVGLSITWIFRRSSRSVKNAEVVERIEKRLHLFEDE